MAEPTAGQALGGAPGGISTLFLCGDVMTGRGIDQIMPQPCDPHLHERYVGSATDYVGLAERVHGPIPRPVGPDYVWGAALEELGRVGPVARIVNLETSITRSETFQPKGINYRMSPENAGCLAAAGIDCCLLANNHVLDWGEAGLLDTLQVLQALGIETAGAGRDLAEAQRPAALKIAAGRRVLVFSYVLANSGTPPQWAARSSLPGVNMLEDLSRPSAAMIARQVRQARRPGDLVVVSLHWGPNWGYEVVEDERRFAHALVDEADVSLVHGHSSHHAKPLEVYRDRLILYGCGDFLNDYEGITGYEAYRDDLALMYLSAIDPGSGDLVALEIVPFQVRRFRLNRPSREDVVWLQRTLHRECAKFGAAIELVAEDRLGLSWC